MAADQVSVDFGGRSLVIETGKLAKQANGAVTVRYGDTIVLVTAGVAKEPREGLDFLPLTVIYQEKTFAAGKIPGGFFKREGRPSEFETLTSRFIDRPIRPLFPNNFHNEMQIIATVLSADQENEPDILAMIGASTSLLISEAPFNGPIAGVRVGRIDGNLTCNPTPDQMEESDIDLIVASSEEAIVMVEGGSLEVSEQEMIEAIMFGHEAVQPVLKIQRELAEKVGKPKFEVEEESIDNEMVQKLQDEFGAKIDESFRIVSKQERSAAIATVKDEAKQSCVPDLEDTEALKVFGQAFKEVESILMRNMILNEKQRIGGRKFDEVREITCETSVLPRTHGSALFTRGETQALVVATLGAEDEAQFIDSLSGDERKRFMLHYNFPPFSVGEVRRLGSPGRREIGHGALAERAIRPMLPCSDDFPYTLRIVAEILESNGSSSMASVCGASLSLMDAGVHIERPVAGIAMGLVAKDGNKAILSDILGDEDHLGDMDFKVTGTEKGITALQMDIKISGIDKALLTEALEQAREGRLHILKKMAEALPEPRSEMSEYAPKLETMKISPSRIRDLIGPGGKNIKGIVAETGAKVNVDDSGEVAIYSGDKKSLEMAIMRIKELTAEAEMGKIYEGKVQKIMEYGAFVEIIPGCDGLLHISQIDFGRINKVTDVLQEGDVTPVKVIKIDPSGKVSLSRTEALKEIEGKNA
jgi:polyribonucleotide nucleotidyltransferase